jgi:eukaryotic-like serine/threonine-protein kinase
MISYEQSEDIFANTIIRQAIVQNTKVKSGSLIDVTVSQGRATDTHSVPDVSLKTLTEAEKILINAGFPIGKITYQINLDVLPNTVLEQYPRAETRTQLGQPVDLIVAQKVDKKTKVEN